MPPVRFEPKISAGETSSIGAPYIYIYDISNLRVNEGEVRDAENYVHVLHFILTYSLNMEQIQTSEINNLKYKQSATGEGKIFMLLKVND
jgi:hypothetical protein